MIEVRDLRLAVSALSVLAAELAAEADASDTPGTGGMSSLPRRMRERRLASDPTSDFVRLSAEPRRCLVGGGLSFCFLIRSSLLWSTARVQRGGAGQEWASQS